jgi:hypothetical protein
MEIIFPASFRAVMVYVSTRIKHRRRYMNKSVETDDFSLTNRRIHYLRQHDPILFAHLQRHGTEEPTFDPSRAECGSTKISRSKRSRLFLGCIKNYR